MNSIIVFVCLFALASAQSYRFYRNSCSGDRGCELRIAAIWGDLEKLSELRQLPGFDVNAVSSSGRTALMAAAYYGETEFVRRLLEDDEIIINKQSTGAWSSYPAGSTALDIARQRNKQDTVKLLEEAGGMPSTQRVLEIPSIDYRYSKNYKVTCTGACGTVLIEVNALSGDPDLKVGLSKGSSSLCSSTKTGSDSCTINTNRRTFYVNVLAYFALTEARLRIIGPNINNIEEQ